MPKVFQDWLKELAIGSPSYELFRLELSHLWVVGHCERDTILRIHGHLVCLPDRTEWHIGMDLQRFVTRGCDSQYWPGLPLEVSPDGRSVAVSVPAFGGFSGYVTFLLQDPLGLVHQVGVVVGYGPSMH